MPVYTTASKIIVPTILPNKISGLQMWLDADDMSTVNSGGIIADGTTASTIKCKISGVVFNKLAGGAVTFKVGAAATGRNSILIVNGVMTGFNVPGLAGANRTTFFVFKYVSLSGTAYNFSVRASAIAEGTNANIAITRFGASGMRYYETNAGSIAVSWTTGVDTTNIHLISCRGVLASGLKKLGFDALKNNLTGVTSDIGATNSINLGSETQGLGNSNCHFCEALYFNTVLSDANYNAVRRYLFNKWGV